MNIYAGSLQRTWKQGIWKCPENQEKLARARKPSVRPLKRRKNPRHSVVDSPHLKKRPRITDILDDSDSYTVDDHYNYLDRISEIRYKSDLFRGFSLHDDNDSDCSSSTYSTRGCASKESEYARCWPSEWLPLDCPGVRVIAVNYTCDPYLWRPFWIRKRNRTTLSERSLEMMTLLTEIGVGNAQPIVWVGHSKGGIYIKKILVDAWEMGLEKFNSLWKSSKGCFFYSVPHRGSLIANWNLPFIKKSIELSEIRKGEFMCVLIFSKSLKCVLCFLDSPVVLDLHRRFVALYRSGQLKMNIFSFIETSLSLLFLRVVRVDSGGKQSRKCFFYFSRFFLIKYFVQFRSRNR